MEAVPAVLGSKRWLVQVTVGGPRGRPFIAYQLSTRGPHIVISYVWAGVATTDQIRSDNGGRSGRPGL